MFLLTENEGRVKGLVLMCTECINPLRVGEPVIGKKRHSRIRADFIIQVVMRSAFSTSSGGYWLCMPIILAGMKMPVHPLET